MNSLHGSGRYVHSLILFLIFIAAYGIFYSYGGRFDVYAHNFWQIVDGELLRNRLWESLWYLHIQPPLFNAYLGAVQKIPWLEPYWVYYISYLTLSFAAAFALFNLICEFRVHPGIALGVVSLCLLTPSWMLYEHWLFYEFPTMALSIFAVARMQRRLKNPTAWNAFILFAILALLFFLRPIFHWAWFAASFFLLLAAAPSASKSLIKGAAIPALLIALFLVKNYWLFGVGSTSTWLGPNLLLMTNHVSYFEHNRNSLDDTFSPIVGVRPFASLEEYEKWIPGVAKQTWGAPVLDAIQRSDGTNNYNHGAYLAIYRYQMQDAIVMIKRFPWKYWKRVCESYRRFCYPSWNNPFFFGQRPSLNLWLAVWNRIFLDWDQQEMGKNFDEMNKKPQKGFFYWFLPVCLAGALSLIFLPARVATLDRNEKFLLIFCFINTILIIFAGTFLLATENNRISFLLTPFLAIYGALIADRYGIPMLRRVILRTREMKNGSLN